MQELRKQDHVSSFVGFSCWYNKIDRFPTLEAVHKAIAFYQNNKIHLLNLGCTLPNLATISVHKSSDAEL